MNDRDFRIGNIVRHFKGNFYEIVDFAYDCTNECDVVIYKALYSDSKLFVRSISEFCSEVDSQKYPDVKQKYRFEKSWI